MFARSFVEIGMEPAAVESALLDDPESWLPRVAERILDLTARADIHAE